jgi:tellurite resistance protein TerC
MPTIAVIDIQWWHWVAFITVIVLFLAIDLGIFHRHARVVKFREAFSWTLLWFSLAMLFALGLRPLRGNEEALEFVTGYIIELSLSMDNVFVIALIFGYFRVPSHLQHRVLFWGILGALIMRGIMIAVGAALVARFHWMLYLFGAFLVFTGVKMIFSRDEGVHPEKNPVLRVARKMFPVTADFVGSRFVVRLDGRTSLTPLALVLMMVETTDLIFALDSIPAIFAVTTKPFIVFTSNVFAILGLRSLYFVLAGALEYFRYLKYGLSIVLVFIGMKMLMPEGWRFTTGVSLGFVAAILCIAVLASVMARWLEKRRSRTPKASAEP